MEKMDERGRGYFSESKIERAAKRAYENGGDYSAIKKAADQEFDEVTNEIITLIKTKINDLF